MKSRDEHLPPAVRVLPMSDRVEGFVGQSIEAIQHDYFLAKLRKQGTFKYCTTGLRSPRGSAVLFQFKARVTASAFLIADESYRESVSGYAGALHFVPSTVHTFQPWDAKQMRTVWPGFTRFGQAKFRLNPGNWPAFVRALKLVNPAGVAGRSSYAPARKAGND